MVVGDFNLSCPWVVVGDFNQIICSSEKKRGGEHFSSTGFMDCINRNGVIDVGFYSQPFTWVNSSSSLNPIRILLDRAICNINYRNSFPEAFVMHLPRIGSDHTPLLLSLISNKISSPNLKPFRFYSMWLEHEDFGSFANQRWQNSLDDIPQKLAHSAENLKHRNKDVYGNILHKKRKFLS